LAGQGVWREAQLREERAALRKALHRVAMAEKWKAENPGSVDA